MRPEIPMMIAGVIEVIIVLRARSELSARGRELTRLVRRIQNPPYPITSEELLEEGQKHLGKGNSVESLKFSITSLVNELKATWGSYPDSPELQEASKLVRSTIYSFVAKLLLVFAAMVVATIITYPR